MNMPVVLACLASLCLSAQGPAPAPTSRPKVLGQASDAVAKALLQREEAWNAAVLKADVAALEQIYAAEYVTIDTKGRMSDRKQELEDIASGAFKAESLQLSDFKLRAYGSVAVVTAINALKGSYKGEKLDERHRITDVWVLRDGRWQCVSSQYTVIQPN